MTHVPHENFEPVMTSVSERLMANVTIDLAAAAESARNRAHPAKIKEQADEKPQGKGSKREANHDIRDLHQKVKNPAAQERTADVVTLAELVQAKLGPIAKFTDIHLDEFDGSQGAKDALSIILARQAEKDLKQQGLWDKEADPVEIMQISVQMRDQLRKAA